MPAGHEVFPFYLMEKYFNAYWPSLGLDQAGFMRLGIKPEAPHAGFNTTVLALKMCNHRNAVSKRHGEVTRKMWHTLWPDLPEDKVPIGVVTNGVHVPSWLDPKVVLLFSKYLGPDWLEHHDHQHIWELVDDIPDKELWDTHCGLKVKLINAIRERARQRWAIERGSTTNVVTGGTLLDPTLLTIGFARQSSAGRRHSR